MMGGRDGSRGYLYQALIAVLEALKDSRWQNICIEYESKDDKVDIALQDFDGMLNVMQVKSSINTFTINNINNWIDALINDVPDAEKFTLILIGNIDAKTKVYVNSIEKLSRNITDGQTEKDFKLMSENIQSLFSKVNIKVLNNDISNFEASMESHLNKLLYNENIRANPNELELMVKALVYQFNVFSTNSQYITRDEFIDKIIRWVTFNYDTDSDGAVENKFDIMYYYKNQFTYDNGRLVFESAGIKESLENTQKKIKELYEIASKINLRKQENIMGINGLARFSFTPFAHDFNFDSDVKDLIKGYFKDKMNIIIEDEFFYLADLKEITTMTNSMYMKKEIKGSKKEEEKYNLILNISKYIKSIPHLKAEIKYFEYLEQYKVLPLCIKNISSRYLQEIEINIRIPKEVEILTPTNFKAPNSSIIEEIEDMLKSSLVKKDDSNVKRYSGERLYAPIENPILDYGMFGPSTQERFNRTMKRMFNYKIFDNELEYTILNCVFNKINAGDVMMFPMHLMVNIDSEFEIKYSIKTKSIAGKQEGAIVVS